MKRFFTILAALLLPLFAWANPTATTVQVNLPACDNVVALGQEVNATVSRRVLLDSTAPYNLADAAVVATVSAGQATYTYTGLTASSDYGLGYECIDGAGNIGARSAALLITTSASSALPIGTLAHDGPATPEQLSLVLPVTGALTNDATATVRYRVSGAGSWVTGHPLYRVRPTYTQGSGYWPGGAVEDVFAWPIIDLSPGVSYDVEVTVDDGVTSEVQTETFATRALPAASGATTTPIAAGSTRAQIQTILNAASAGDVIEFEDGTYNLGGDDLELDMDGATGNPIYVRGQSRDGVILTNGAPRVLYFTGESNHVVIERLTIDGPGVDSGLIASAAIQFFDGVTPSSHMTLRNLTITGHNKITRMDKAMQAFLLYDNTFTGNNDWEQDLYAYGGSGAPGAGDGTPDVIQNLFWNDDALNVPGIGHAIFNNTIVGFGDSLSYCSHAGSNATAECRGIHMYRNEVRGSGDDCAEVDYAFRNVTMYDNHCTNGMTAISLDNAFGGPFLFARNTFINIGRSPYKFNGTISGMFLYNNTLIRTEPPDGTFGEYALPAGWYQPNNGALRSWGYVNNLFLYENAPNRTFWLEETGNTPIDFTHNSWRPDSTFSWSQSGGSNASLALAAANLPAVAPVFGTATQRHTSDNILASQPFATPITMGASYLNEVAGSPSVALSTGTNANNTGKVVPNITDGYTGVAPDRGAVIAGRTAVQYGDRSIGTGGTAWVDSVAVGTVAEIPGTRLDSVDPCPDDNCEISGSIGQYGVMQAWGGAAWDYTEGCMIVAGGGHGDYFGNEIYRLCTRAATPQWERVREPTTGANFSQDLSWCQRADPQHPDGSMRSRHTRSLMAYSHIGGAAVYFPGAGGTSPCVTGDPQTWRYPLTGGGDYVALDNRPGSGAMRGAAETHPDTGIIWLADDGTGSLASFNPAATPGAMWTAHQTESMNKEGSAAIDTLRNKMLVSMFQDPCSNKLYDLTSPETNPTSPALSSVCSSNTGLVYDPDTDDFVTWGSGNDLKLIDPVTFAVTTQTFTGATVPARSADNGNGVYGRLRYDRQKKVYILATANDQNVYVFRRTSP